MPIEPIVTPEWRDHDRAQRRRTIIGWAAAIAMIGGAIALPVTCARAEFGTNEDRGYESWYNLVLAGWGCV